MNSKVLKLFHFFGVLSLLIISVLSDIEIDQTSNQNSLEGDYDPSSESESEEKLEIWQHSLILMKYPFNREELRQCLFKSFVFESNLEAAMLLGKFWLFEWPEEQKQYTYLFKNNTSKCSEIPSLDPDQNESLIEIEEIVQQYINTSWFERCILCSLQMFKQADKAGHEDAPLFQAFLMDSSKFLNIFGSIGLNSQQNSNYVKLQIFKSIERGSYLARKQYVSQQVFCKKSLKLKIDFKDIIQKALVKQIIVQQNQSEYTSLEKDKQLINEPNNSIDPTEFINAKYNEILNQTEIKENLDFLKHDLHLIESISQLSHSTYEQKESGSCGNCEEILKFANMIAEQEIEYQFDNSIFSNYQVDSDYYEDNLEKEQEEYSLPSSKLSEELQILITNAEYGYAESQYELAQIYYQGNNSYNIRQNLELSIHYYELASENGSPKASFTLGKLYDVGEEVEQNSTLARDYYVKAIDQGDLNSYNELGCMYYDGSGIGKDLPLAIEYLEIGAFLGIEQAIYNLATLRYEGIEGLEKDTAQALKEMKQIATKHKQAIIFLINERKNGAEIEMTCEELLELLQSQNLQNNQDEPLLQIIEDKLSAGKTEDALLYSLFASFIGVEEAHFITAKIFQTKVILPQNNQTDDSFHLNCVLEDNQLCSLMFYYQSSVRYKEQFFVQLGHMLHQGIKSLPPDYKTSFLIYNSSSYLPESLHSISCQYEQGEYLQRNLTKAIELNEQILSRVISGEFELNIALPTFIRKVYLHIKQLLQFMFI